MHVFSGAYVIDGNKTPGFYADVVVEGDTITKILRAGSVQSETALSCSGLVLCPGFVDMHGHSDVHVLKNPTVNEKLRQGITTEVCGNCGIGLFPSTGQRTLLDDLASDVLGTYEKRSFRDFNAYLQALKEKGSGINMAFLQAHSTLRSFVMEGGANRRADKTEVSRMCKELERSLSQGCLGFSSGLYYAPCLFADDYEILSLLKTVAEFDRLFSVHIRCEGNEAPASVLQVLSYAQKAKVRLQISHLKVIGKRNQHLVPQVLKLIEDAHSDGLDVQFDQYPYTYGSTSLFSLLPPSYVRLERATLQSLLGDENTRKQIQEQMENPEHYDSIVFLCGWDQIRILALSSNSQYEGMTIAEIAAMRKQNPYDAFFDLLKEERGTALMTDVTQSHASIKQILCHPLMCFGTDALYAGMKAHPRSYQAAIHLLDRYWKQEEVLPLESLIAKMSSNGAKRLGLSDRGYIQEGCKADLVLIDTKSLKDCSDASHPDKVSKGIKLVMVNGKVAYTETEQSTLCNGSLLLYS